MFWIDKIMKNLILILMFCTFLVSYQTETQSENFNSKAIIQVQNYNTEKIDTNTNEMGEIQPLVSPTALLKITDINSKVGIVDVDDVQYNLLEDR